MSRRAYAAGVLVEEWDDDTDTYRRHDDGAVVLERAYTAGEVAAKPVPIRPPAPGHALLGVSGRKYEVVAGVIRNFGGPAYWQALDDAGHRPMFIDSVTTSTIGVVIHHTSVAATKIACMIAVPDETLTAAGFTAGVSAGLASSTITLTRHHPAHTDYVSYNGNSWVSANGVFTDLTWDATTGTLTAHHPRLAPAAAFAVSAVAIGTANRCAIPTLSYGSVNLRWLNSSGATITTLNAGMGVYLSRGGHHEAVVNPREIDTTTFPGGNVWVIGVMETA